MAAPGGEHDDAPIVRYVNNLIEQAIQNRASDLHLEPTEDDMRVRYRIDGVLHELDTVPRGVMAALISRIKIMSGVDITEKRVPQNGRITVADPGPHRRPADGDPADRVGREDRAAGAGHRRHRPGHGQAGLHRAQPDALRRVVHQAARHGAGTGPTGSGKSTTLYATLGQISQPDINVITVEDPVEYRLRGVNQVQVNAQGRADVRGRAAGDPALRPGRGADR